MERMQFLIRVLLIAGFIQILSAVERGLNDNWSLRNVNKGYKIDGIQLPSGVYTELENKGLAGSVLYSYNDVDLRWIGLEDWNYTNSFTVTEEDLQQEHVILTFHGLDTLAQIYLNDQYLGEADNMFIRYRFDIKQYLSTSQKNRLVLRFRSAVTGAKDIRDKLDVAIPPECPPASYSGECHVNLIRKMQASFAWDWGLAAPSVGIWKNVALEFYDSAQIRDVNVKLVDEYIDDVAVWNISLNIYFELGVGSEPVDGILSAEILDIADSKIQENVLLQTNEDGEVSYQLDLQIPKSKVKTWWPNGLGDQSFHFLKVQWEDSRINEIRHRQREFFQSEKMKRIGFRTIELIQEPLEEDDGLTFYFKVNGIPIFMKGSNWIPSHILPEKAQDPVKLKSLLLAAKDANMNMLRVWGGGFYESDTFYDLADEMGILIWQDMMFACAMYRSDQDFLNSVRIETRQNVRRLQHHPSIAIYATNNENEVALVQNWYGTNDDFAQFAEDYYKLYVDTIQDEIYQNDLFRHVLVSSPSNGLFGERANYTISKNPQDVHFGDVHFYNYISNGWDSRIFPQPRFASEYGFQSYPSLNAWNGILDKKRNSSYTQIIRHRQHSPLADTPIITLIEHNIDISKSWDTMEWADKIYLSQVSQAMAIKAETEVYRTGRQRMANTMGALYWQLNDVWVAPSWSSIEFNGNFKILHYWIKSVFASRTVITLQDKLKKVQIYAISDQISAKPEEMLIHMKLYKWSGVRVVKEKIWSFNMTSNAVSHVDEFDFIQYLKDLKYEAKNYVAEFSLIDSKDRHISKNYIYPVNFKDVSGVVDPKVQLSIASVSPCNNKLTNISLIVKIEHPAIFVDIQLNHDQIPVYQLSNNGFLQFDPIQTIHLTFENPNCNIDVKNSDFIVNTLNSFLK